MDLELTTLLVVCVAIAGFAAGVLSLFGAMQPTHRGFRWWIAAQWTVVGALLLEALPSVRSEARPLIDVLLLAWPVAVLTGLRRLDLRKRPSVLHAIDASALALVSAVVVATWLVGGGPLRGLVAFTLSAFCINLYAAAMVTRLNGFGQTFALKALAVVEALTAVLEATCGALAGFDAAGASGLRALQLAACLAMVVAAFALVPIAIALTYERTVAKMHALHRKLRHLADVDGLTRLPNRRHFHELATRTLAGVDPAGAVVLMFDIENLKRINDLLGQPTGDEALRQVGLALRETLRSRDVIGRLGGDEFAALLPDTPIENAVRVAERVNERLENRQVAPNTVRLTLNVGAVQMKPGEAIVDALRRADAALDDARDHRHDRPRAAHGADGGARSDPASGWTTNAA